MLKVYVCEDNREQRAQLDNYIDEILSEEDLDIERGVCSANPFEIIDLVEKENVPGIFFLDVDLGAEINGIELASQIRKLQPRCYIIFVTTHSEMAFMTFQYKVEAMDFIIKDEMADMKSRVRQCILQANERDFKQEADDNLFIKNGDKVTVVPFGDIIYFEVATDIRKIIVHVKDAIMAFSGKLKDLEVKLDDRFYKCHRAFIVNREYIKDIDKTERIVYFVNGDSCPISVRLAKDIRQ